MLFIACQKTALPNIEELVGEYCGEKTKMNSWGKHDQTLSIHPEKENTIILDQLTGLEGIVKRNKISIPPQKLEYLVAEVDVEGSGIWDSKQEGLVFTIFEEGTIKGIPMTGGESEVRLFKQEDFTLSGHYKNENVDLIIFSENDSFFFDLDITYMSKTFSWEKISILDSSMCNVNIETGEYPDLNSNDLMLTGGLAQKLGKTLLFWIFTEDEELNEVLDHIYLTKS